MKSTRRYARSLTNRVSMCSLGSGDYVRAVGFALREREQGARASFVNIYFAIVM